MIHLCQHPDHSSALAQTDWDSQDWRCPVLLTFAIPRAEHFNMHNLNVVFPLVASLPDNARDLPGGRGFRALIRELNSST
jgi:hypothetical protein